jgi:predicted nucleotide-binding protein (sugar kinase/HSP70/actin superfamily)
MKRKRESELESFKKWFKKLGMTLEEAYEKFNEEFLAQQEEDKKLAEECSSFLQRKLPPKQEDPGIFTIPCHIGGRKIQ